MTDKFWKALFIGGLVFYVGFYLAIFVLLVVSLL